MAKRWTFEDDTFLHAFYEGMGDWIGQHDLGRPKGAATRRVRHLKQTGAWDALTARQKATNDYYAALYPNAEYSILWQEERGY